MMKRFVAAAAVVASLVASNAPAHAQTPPPADPADVTTTTQPANAPVASSVLAGAPVPLPPTPTVPVVTNPAAGNLEALLPTLTPITDDAEMAALHDRYGSLSTAMINLWAQQAGVDVATFVETNKAGIATAFNTPSLMDLSTSGGADLTSQLAKDGVAVDPRTVNGGLASYSDLLAENQKSIESQVSAAGIQWATDMAAVRDPQVTAPDMPTLAAPEAQMFGLLADRAVTAMVTDQPNLFAQVRNSGLGTPASGAAWRSSMLNALAATSNPKASDGMLSPCYAAMMTAMGSGDSTAAASVGGKACSPCVTTGLYLNGQMSRLFDPQTASATTNTTDKLLPPAEFNDLAGWQRQIIVDQNPSLKNGLNSAMSAGSSASSTCGASAPATAKAANTVLPGVFSQLKLG